MTPLRAARYRHRGAEARRQHRHRRARNALVSVSRALRAGGNVRDPGGAGTLRVAGEMLPLRAGDIAFIPPGPEYPHQIINTSPAPLKYLSIGTRDSPEICEYPDSNKFLATASTGDGKRFDALQRNGGDLDYWDGEP